MRSEKTASVGDSPLWVRLFPIVLILSVDYIGFNMMLPMIPFYAKKYGADTVTIGLLFSIYAVCQLIASPILGSLSDRYGRKRVLLLSQLGTLASFILMFFADSLAPLFLARALDGLTGGNVSLALAHMVDVSKPHEKTTALGQQILANGVGLLLGAALAGSVFAVDTRYPALIAAGFSLLSILTTIFLLKDQSKPKASSVNPAAESPGKLAIVSRKTAPFIVCLACYHLIWGLYYTGIGVFCAQRFASEFGAAQSGFLYSYMGIYVIAFPVLLLPFLVRRLSDKKIVRLTFATTAASLALLSLVPSWLHVLAIVPLIHFGTIPLRPAMVSLFSSSVDKGRQGLALGLNQSLVALGAIIGPLIGGAILKTGESVWWPMVPSALALVGLVISLVHLREKPQLSPIPQDSSP